MPHRHPHLPAWSALDELRPMLEQRRIADLFTDDAHRASAYAIEAAGLYLDYSKNLIDNSCRTLLLALAEQAKLGEAIEAMFRGERINRTENRAVLHTALRGGADQIPPIEGQSIGPDIERSLEKMRRCVEAVHSGEWRGCTGESIQDIVSIGIGGSHLGPQLVCEALRYDVLDAVRVHFVANVDGGNIDRVLADLNPARTLFIIASKSFTTVETALNARSAISWLRHALDSDQVIRHHFLAISAHPERAHAFGIDPDNVLPMWDWVGGRYSLWSAIGLPIALAVGMDAFELLLSGAASMDRHFRESDFAENMPVMLALVGIWNNNFLGAASHATVPYDDRLASLAPYLQQLDMESNGKRVTLDNCPTAGHTAPILWGGLGTNAQHAFFQLLHQGTRRVPVDFIIALSHPVANRAHHDMLIANCFAQAEALMTGRSFKAPEGQSNGGGIELSQHRESPGNQPSNMLTLDRLTPSTLGALLALYEHKTFVQGIVWGINSFDQFGVELGKGLATSLLEEIEREAPGKHDASTTTLLKRYLAVREKANGDR